MASTYLFVDESGDMNFSVGGSPYFYFGALSTADPLPLTTALTSLRYDFLADGLDIDRFHAPEDRQAVRDRVYATIRSVGGFQFDSVVVDKRKTPPPLYEEARFYPQIADYLLGHIVTRYAETDHRVVVITDRLPVKRKRDAVEKAFKMCIRKRLGDRPFAVFHQSSVGHACLQAADYCTWAVHKKWRDGELRPHRMIEPFIKNELEIFQRSNERFY